MADLLLVDACYIDRCRIRASDGETFGHWHFNGVGEANGENELLFIEAGLVADGFDLELLPRNPWSRLRPCC